MSTVIRMPELAANTPEATLVEWLVEEGASVTAGDAIATVETAKATVDIEAEVSGVVLRLVVEGGTDVEVGGPIAVIGEEGERLDEQQLAGVPWHDATPPEAPAAPAPVPVVAIADPPPAERRIFASPLARRLARDNGLELAAIPGTGPNGRVRRRDVDAALAARAQAADESDGAAPVARSAPVVTVATTAEPPDGMDIPHTRLRRAIAARLVESKQTAPHFYIRGTARVDALLDLRGRLNDETGQRISVNDLVLKAVAKAHVAVPAMNVVWGPESVRQFHHVDIAVAVATEQGLVTPVLRNADTLSLSAIAGATRDYAERARAGALHPSDLEGGSISVSNLGMFGTEEFTAIINPPQAAVLAVGAAVPSAVVVDGELAVARTVTVNLSVDHRPVDGAVAAEWMREFLALLEQPLRLLT
jgi:pyruvate dehydrogenase E2 component (dihydrolipoamide acetyltransferase)